MKTIGLIDNDISVDELGNLFMKSGANQVAQDVASSVKVWKGELPMNIERGVNYAQPDLIRNTLMFDINDQAQLIEGVSESTVVFNSIENRKLNTTIYVRTDSGEDINVNEYLG